MFRKFWQFVTKLQWWQLVALVTSLTIVGFLLYKLVAWLLPICLLILGLIYIYSEGEFFSLLWQKYKQTHSGYEANPILEDYFYNWLTENGVTELPISTNQYLQGVERYSKEGIYFIHLNEKISTELLDSFTIKSRQQVKLLSYGSHDCVVSFVEKEPFIAIKVRLLPSDELILQSAVKEEDF